MNAEQIKGIAKVVDMLAARWEDEAQYEDFKDYIKRVKQELKAPAKLVSMANKPFEVVLDDGKGFRHTMKATATHINHDKVKL